MTVSDSAGGTNQHKAFQAAIATVLAVQMVGTASAVDIGIVNGDFEADAANSVAPPSGWTDLTPTSFWTGIIDGSGNPTAAEAALAPAPGLGDYFLTTARTSAGVGSQPTDGTLIQTVDLTPFGGDIDTGDRFLYVDFIWASEDLRDTGVFTLDFFGTNDGTGTSLASFNLNLDNNDGFNFTGWFEETVGGAVPVSTRSVTLQIDTTRSGGSETNLWFDNFVGDISNTALAFNLWNVDADGVFSLGSNWSDGVPPADADVTFGSIITADRTVTLDSNVQLNSIAFNNSGDGEYFIVNNGGGETLTLTGDANVEVQAGRHWLRAEVAGSGGLNATGAGELVLDAANSFSGGVTVDGANLAIVRTDAIPAGNDIAVSNNGQVSFWGPDNDFFVTQSGAPGYGTGTVATDVSIDATSVVDVNSGADVTFSGDISGDGEIASNSGASVTLTNANSFAGVATVNSGNLTITNSSALGVGDSTAATGTVIGGLENTGALVLPGGLTIADELLTFSAREGAGADAVGLSSTGNNTWNGNVLGTVGGTQYNIESNSGTLTFGGIISAPDTSVRNYVFSGDGNFVVNTITDAVVDANGDIGVVSVENNVSVTKRGAGTLTIDTQTDANDDYWYGPTTVEGGSLVVNSDGSNNGELRSTVTVNAGATFDVSDFATYNLLPIAPYEVGIGGGGTVVANALGVFESSTVTPGDSVGTLKVNGNVNLTYFDSDESVVPNSGSFDFELGDDASINAVDNSENDLISVSGTLAINTASAGDQFVFNVTPVDGALDESTNYTLIQAGTRTGGAASNFAVNLIDALGNPLVSRQTASVVLSGNNVLLDVNGNPLNLVWSGNVDNNWDVNATANWNGGAQTFFAGDSTTFNATGGGGAVNVAEAVTPGNVTITGADYSFAGADINAGSVTVGGGATATFDNTVRGDVLAQNTGTVAGTGTFADNVTVQSGGTLMVGGDSLPLQAVLTYLDATDGVGGNTTLSAGGTFTPTTNPDWQIRSGFANNGQVYQGGSDDTNSAPELKTTITGLTPGEEYTVYANFWGALTGSGVTQWRILAGSVSGDLELYDAPYTNVAGATDGVDLSTLSYINAPLITEDNRTLFGADLGTLTANANGEIEVFIDDTGTVDGDDRTWYDGVSYGSGATAFASASMLIQGDLTLATGSTLSLDIASPTALDTLTVEGLLNAGGTLDVNLASGATLAEGDAFDLLDFTTLTGSFAALDLPTLSGTLEWDTSSLLIDGILAVINAGGIFGDYNNSGQVEQGDLDLVLQNWGDTDISDATAWTNFAGLPGSGIDGQVEQTELDLVLSNWGSTSAPDFAGSAVPEPATVSIIGLVGVLGMRRRR